MMIYRRLFPSLMAGFVALGAVSSASAETKPRKLVLIAGKPSHPPLMHEFHAGSMLLAKRLAQVPGLVVDRHDMGWPKDEATFADADAVVIYCDGGPNHPALAGEHLKTLDAVAQRGGGLGFMHYGVEITAGPGGQAFQKWIGGYYENAFSCNPMWEPSFTQFAEHPVTRGVKPFSIKDEWYINMRFRPGLKDGTVQAEDGEVSFTPILVAAPSEATRNGPYVHPAGPYPHIQAEKGAPEAMMWTVQRTADTGRGFGFTGGHFHLNWQNENFRKVVLNALCWVTKIEIPVDGIASEPVSDAEAQENLDPKVKKKQS
jgi:Trehalose utilisation